MCVYICIYIYMCYINCCYGNLFWRLASFLRLIKTRNVSNLWQLLWFPKSLKTTLKRCLYFTKIYCLCCLSTFQDILFRLFLNRGARPPTLLICCLVLPYTHNGDNDRSGSKMHFTLFYKVGIFCQGWPQALVVLPPCGQLLCLNYKCMLFKNTKHCIWSQKIPLDTSVAHQGWRQQENKNFKRSNRLIFSSAL